MKNKKRPVISGITAAADGLQTQKAGLDPFCVEKNLHSWASSRVIAKARDYYRKGNVISLESYEDNRIVAQVAGTTESPYRVEIRFDKWGMPVSKCTCPFDWEPLCKHAAAALLAWQREETGSEPAPIPAGETRPDPGSREKYLGELAEIEREERRARCGEQGIRILRKPANGPLGAYLVSSAEISPGSKPYQVTIRDAEFAHATCGCLDFLKNELGTCKHIEKVKRLFRKPAAARGLLAAERRARTISVYHMPRESHKKLYSPAEEIRFYVPPDPRAMAAEEIKNAVDPLGYLLSGTDPVARRLSFEKLAAKLRARGFRVDVAPEVRELLQSGAEAFKWERRMDEIAASPETCREWRNSAGAAKIPLHPYQKDGILYAVKKRRAFIGDDMGLGKTVQAICAALFLKELGEIRRAVVIAPASLKFQWKREIEKVCRESAAVVSGSAGERAELYKTSREFFLILNYELLYRDLEAVRALKADLIILDEAQRIKNWETKIARNVKKLQSPFCLVLTGTPLQNRLQELHSISESLHPRALGPAWKLLPTYAELDENDRISGYTNLEQLRARMSSFLIRRTRAAVLPQLPGRTDNNYWTALTPRQGEVHSELSSQVVALLRKLEKFGRLAKEDLDRLMMLLTCMRIVSNAFGQYDWKTIELEVLTAGRASPALRKKIGSPKLEEFERVLSDLLADPARKVVIFSQWERMLRLAEIYSRETLETLGCGSVLFCGSVPLKKREQLVRRFIEDPAARVFFSTDAGGVGLNLQEASDCVINLEIPWNPAVLEQRIGRVHRMGQKKSVEVINLISSESIEERIFNLLGQKKALFSGIFDEGTSDIRFDAAQKASFAEKMKMIVPSDDNGGARAGGPGPEIPAQADAASDAVTATAPGAGTGGPALQTACGQTGGAAAPRAVQIDLAPAASALSGLLGLPGGKAGGAGEGFKMLVSEDQAGLHFTVPKQTAELLKGLRPLMEALLKLSAG